jgi:effector-binding domain-containing protein
MTGHDHDDNHDHDHDDNHDHDQGDDHGDYAVERATLTKRPTLVLRGTIPATQVPAFMGSAFARVSQVARADGIPISGPPFARVHPEGDRELTLEVGFPVSGVVLGQGEVKASHLPSGQVLRTTHLGDYAGTARAHEALTAFASRHGLHASGDAWEVYLSEPDVAVPRTLVVLPVEAAQATS